MANMKIKGAARVLALELDGCGRPVADVSKQIVTGSFASVTVKQTSDDAKEYTQDNANGVNCIYSVGNPSMKGAEIDLDLCGVCVDFVNIVSGSETYGTDGFQMVKGEVDKRFMLILWLSIIPDGSICDSDVTGNPWGLMVFPNVSAGTIGDYKIDGKDVPVMSISGMKAQTSPVDFTKFYNLVKDENGDPAMLPAADANVYQLFTKTLLDPPEESANCDATVYVPVAE